MSKKIAKSNNYYILNTNERYKPNYTKEMIKYIIDKGITTQNYEHVKEKQKLSYINGKTIPLRNPDMIGR